MVRITDTDDETDAPEDLKGEEFAEWIKRNRGKKMKKQPPGRKKREREPEIEHEPEAEEEQKEESRPSFDERHPKLAKIKSAGKKIMGFLSEKADRFEEEQKRMDKIRKNLFLGKEPEDEEEERETRTTKRKSRVRSSRRILPTDVPENEEDISPDEVENLEVDEEEFFPPERKPKKRTPREFFDRDYKPVFRGNTGKESYEAAQVTERGLLNIGKYQPVLIGQNIGTIRNFNPINIPNTHPGVMTGKYKSIHKHPARSGHTADPKIAVPMGDLPDIRIGTIGEKPKDKKKQPAVHQSTNIRLPLPDTSKIKPPVMGTYIPLKIPNTNPNHRKK